MDPAGTMRSVADSDAHIAATEDNENGFQEGSWVPYLNVAYELTKQGSAEVLKGHFHPMVANDGRFTVDVANGYLDAATWS